MRLRRLTTGDRFYYKKSKYQVFFTLKTEFKPKGKYTVHCINWPMPNGSHEFSSEINVKPIVKTPTSDQTKG